VQDDFSAACHIIQTAIKTGKVRPSDTNRFGFNLKAVAKETVLHLGIFLGKE
jgi:hypothetical protein